MKKLTRKLFLSVAALAVCATTLVSTTFAWYVSNSEASVDKITGSTAGTDVSGNLLVAKDKDGAPDAFTQHLSLDVTLAAAEALNPVTKATAEDAENSIAVGDWVDKDGNKVTTGTAMTFSFWIMSTKDQTVNVSYLATNTTAADALKTQRAYTSTGAPVSQGADFTIDAVNALRMQVVTTEATPVTKTLAFDATHQGEATAADAFTANTTGDANTYYYQLLGTTPYGCNETTGASVAAPTDTWETLSLVADTAVKLTFTVWLEGTDADCFDSCISQTFDFQFNFEVAGA